MVWDPLPLADEFWGLLQGLAHNHPQLFYKPLFTCAATTKDHVVVDQLRIVVTLTWYTPHLLTHEVNMTTIMPVSNSRTILGKGKAKEDVPPPWAVVCPGQLAIILDLILRMEQLTKERSLSTKIAPSNAIMSPFAASEPPLLPRVQAALVQAWQMQVVSMGSGRMMQTMTTWELAVG